MALQKSIETEFGTDATYWAIGATHEDYQGGAVQVTIFGWIDEKARRSGKKPAGTGQIVMSGAEYAPDAAREWLYGVLKSKPEFAGAEDV